MPGRVGAPVGGKRRVVRDPGRQRVRVGGRGETRRVAALHPARGPDRAVEELAEPLGGEQRRRLAAPRVETHALEPQRPRLVDRVGEHGSGEAPAPVRGRDAQPLVEHDLGSDRAQALETDHEPLLLHRLDSPSRRSRAPIRRR